MNICLECGCEFDDCEVWNWMEAHGEHFSGCPMCGGAYEQARCCYGCGQFLLDDDLTYGYCVDCLIDSIDYDKAYQFFKETGWIEAFIFEGFYESETPDYMSDKLRKACEERFFRMRRDDEITQTHGFLDTIRAYIIYDEESGCKDRYAKWLREQERERAK